MNDDPVSRLAEVFMNDEIARLDLAGHARRLGLDRAGSLAEHFGALFLDPEAHDAIVRHSMRIFPERFTGRGRACQFCGQLAPRSPWGRLLWLLGVA